MTLNEMAQHLNELYERKGQIEQEEEDNKAAIEEIKKKMAEKFLDDDCDSTTVGGYTFSLAAKTAYSKKSEEKLADAGLVFFDVLRENGLGDIIVPTVNARTLQSTISAYVEEHGELTGNLAAAINAYDYTDVTRRKAAAKKKKGAKK